MNAIPDEKVGAFVNAVLNIESNDPPKMLHHYTSSCALLKIIATKIIWMSNIFQTNDSKEFVHGMELFRSNLNLINTKIPQNYFAIFESYFDKLQPRSFDIYIFSTTTKFDQLSQWRGYGDNSKGISIGLNTTEYLSGEDMLHCSQIIYEKSLQENIVKQTIEIFFEQIVNSKSSQLDNEFWESCASIYFLTACLQSIRFKHITWQEEDEWRFIKIIPANDISRGNCFLRSTTSGLKKTYQKKISKIENSISQITLGPLNNMANEKMSLNFLKETSHFKFKIEESNIPIRE